MSNLPSAYSNSPKHTPTLMRALQALQTTTFPPHHQVLCIPLYLSPYSLYLPKASSLKRLLPSTKATKKKNTSAKGKDKGKEEEEEEDDDEDEQEMKYLALDYSQEDFGDDSDTYASWSP
ncbi:uncharacterized protein LOC115951679 [Quercus lobata]|uniref:uncharacterized protein LOC115951679 n=1 Tax=Quercus lobata TaxID=97700 RepID=UPI001246888C|nr:uncharacterized protein LOC115951679 [Quercus lobata]